MIKKGEEKMIDRKITWVVVSFIIAAGLAPAVLSGAAPGSVGQSSVRTSPTPSDPPPYGSYKGISLGQTVDEARAKLGVPKEKMEATDYFEFSEHESAQVYYDASQKVIAITVTYSGKLDGAPKPMAIFGEDAEVKPDGGIFKMVRYPKAGYWISYNRTTGDDALVLIAMQKM